MSLVLIAAFFLAVGVVVGIGIAPTVYGWHAAYIIAKYGESKDDKPGMEHAP